MNSNSLFDKALSLGERGNHEEAARLFALLASKTDNLFDKAGILLNVAHEFKELRDFQHARIQLEVVHELLSVDPSVSLASIDEENRRGLLIGAALEDARIWAAEEKVTEAIEKLNSLLADYQLELAKPAFESVKQLIQRERAFLLTDIGSCSEALPILEDLDATEPHDRWILFYLGYCYMGAARYDQAKTILQKALQLGLSPDFEGRAHCALGVSLYGLKDYQRAKIEFEKGVKTASKRYIREAGIWRWLQQTCIALGLGAEAQHYAELVRLDKGAGS